MSSTLRLHLGVPCKILGIAALVSILFVLGCSNLRTEPAMPPIISGLSANSGAVGSSITISGANFGTAQAAVTVTFNSVTASITSLSNTSIVVTVPTSATTGNVEVVVSGAVSNLITFVVPAIITSLSANSGAVGSPITITGTNFGTTQGNSTVSFNGTPAGTATSWSATSIAVTVPVGATTGNVVVTVSGVASNGILFTNIGPSISSLSQNSGLVGMPITIFGSNFGATQQTSTVTFNGISAGTASAWSATSITVVVPVGATTGNVVVNVGTFTSNALPFTIVPPPSISSLSQSSGAVGVLITITGANFGATQGSGTVTFNTTVATTVTSWSATSIRVIVPAGATTGNVVVTVSGIASNGLPFAIVLPPSITSLSQNSGAVGQSITITGTNFGATQGSGTVSFNGTAALVTSWSASSIVVTVPSDVTSGNVVVTVLGSASNGIFFTVVTNPCGSGSESVFNGQYAFVMQGFDPGGAMALAGTIYPNGSGGFTAAGLEDYNRSTGSSVNGPLAINTTGSSYSVGSDGRGCMTLVTLAGTSVFRISLGTFTGAGGSATNGHLIESDSTGTTGSGVIRQQSPSQFSLVSGNYAFGGSSPPTSFKSAQGRYAVAGYVNITSGGVLSGDLDINEGGVMNLGAGVAPLPFSGTTTINTTTGRGTNSIIVNNGATLTSAIYVVSSTEVLEIGTDSQSGSPGYWPYAVTLLQQTGNPFTSGVGPVGSAMVLNDGQQTYSSPSTTPIPLAEVGLITIPSANTFSFSSDQWNGTALSSITGASVTTTVTSAPEGRVSLSIQGVTNPLIAYLVTSNEGFIVGTDTSTTTPTVESGFLQPQTVASFSNSSASGNYSLGTRMPMNANVTEESGVATFDGVGTNSTSLSVTTDSTSQGTQTVGQINANTYSIAANGRGTSPGVPSAQNPLSVIFYMISPTKSVVMDTTGSNAKIDTAQQ
jgi:hypothetical protein